MLNKFLDYLKANSKSPRTVQAYGSDLAKFFIAFPAPESVTADEANAHFAAIRETMAHASYNRYVAVVKSFYEWAVAAGHVTTNPAALIRLKGIHHPERPYLTDAESVLLLKTLKMSADPLAVRDLTMIHLFLATGIRLSELVDLNLEDIQEKHLTVRSGKGGKPAIKFLGESIRSRLKEYMKERRRFPNINERALFLGRDTRISRNQVENRIRGWIKKSGIKKTITPHSLRHSFAARLLEQTKDVTVVQKALGHANIGTTMVYAHLLDGTVEGAVQTY